MEDGREESQGDWRSLCHQRDPLGSAGLDLRSTTRLILIPQMGVQIVSTDFKGPLPENTVRLLLGRSSSALKGLRIHPGVIDPDFTGVVKIMVESPKGISAISPGDKIAQLLLLPSLRDLFPAEQKEAHKGLGHQE